MSKAGRKGHEYEQAMEQYRKWFSTGTVRTQYRNATKLKKYCDWIEQNPEQLIEEYTQARKNVNTYNEWKRETRKKIIEFYNALISEGYKINTARTEPLGILRFYSDNCETIKGVTTQFDPTQIPTNEYVFTQDDLRKSYYYSDLEGQTLLSLAVALGYSSIDFLTIESQKMKNLVNEATDKNLEFIQFIGKSRTKTSVQPRSHLTPEAINCLKDYLPLLERKYGELPKYLWANNEGSGHLTNQGLNKKFRTLIKNANIKTYGKKVRFHLLRKFLYSRLQAKNRDVAKVICAKKVSASDITYMPNLDAECLRIFKETYKEFALNGDVTGKNRRKQTEEIEALKKEVEELRLFNKMLSATYGDEIVRKAREALQQGRMSKEAFAKVLKRFNEEKK